MSESSASSSRRNIGPRLATVVAVRSLGSRMRRLTLADEILRGEETIHAGAHIKLMIPAPGESPRLPTHDGKRMHWPEGERPAVRTYSVRRHDPEQGRLDIDFVLHGDDGPASRWAARAEPGDDLGIAGPGGPPLFRDDADFHLLAGDLSALPAIAAVLEALPEDAQGAAFVELDNAADQQALRVPPGVSLQWLHRRSLLGAVRATPWPASNARLSATVAGESGAVMAIRKHLLEVRGLARQALYAVPYWRRGLSEEQYHAERHRQMDEEE